MCRLQERQFLPIFEPPPSRLKHQCKVVIVGESGAGKTSLMNKYFSDHFDVHEKSTAGVDFRRTVISLPMGLLVEIMFWDTAGQERFRSLTQSYLRNADGVMIVYETVRLDHHREERLTTAEDVLGPKGIFVSHFESLCEDPTKLPLHVIFGNKSDLLNGREPALPANPLRNHFVGSAKDGTQVNAAFKELIYGVALLKACGTNVNSYSHATNTRASSVSLTRSPLIDNNAISPVKGSSRLSRCCNLT